MTEVNLADLKVVGGGSYPERSRISGRAIAYICMEYGTLCSRCANGENGSRAADADLDPDCPDDHQWIISNFMYCGPEDDEFCHHCGVEIE